MDWIDTEFKALLEVIFGASDFAVVFSVESILKLLRDFARDFPNFPTLRALQDFVLMKTS
jgi:hypothetical protein